MNVGQQRLEPLTTEEAPLVKPAFRRENPQYGMIGRIEAKFFDPSSIPGKRWQCKPINL